MMCKIRGEYQSHPRPQWISEEIMQQLIQQWKQDDYKERRDKARRNRASSIGGTLYTGGSIPTSEHMRRLERQHGRKPRLVDLFIRTHRKRGTEEFIDERSREVYEEYNRLKSSQAPTTSGNSQQQDDDATDVELWLQAVGGKNKKGHIFGIGSEACEIGTSIPYSVSPSDLHPDFEEELQRRMEPVIDELRAQKEEINTQKEKIDAQATIINDMRSMVDRFINSVDRRWDTPTVDDDDETQPPDHPLD